MTPTGHRLNIQPGNIVTTIRKRDILLGGDVIVEVGGHTVYATRKGYERLLKYINDVASGEFIEITVMRKGQKEILTATKP